MNRKKYTNEFKEETVKLIIEQGYTQAEASRNLGISDTNINRWLKGAGTSTVKTKPTTEQAELIRLKSDLNYAKENVKFIQDNLVRECGTCRHENHAQTCDSCKNSSLWEYRNG